MTETFDTRALKMLVERLEVESERRRYALGEGAASSMEDYKHRVGFLQALKVVREFCVEVEAELYGGNER